MAIPNLKVVSDDELLALRDVTPGSQLTRRESERVWNEIVRRRELKNDPYFGHVLGEREAEPNTSAQQERPFDPKRDVSADAHFLWDRIWL